MRETLRVLVIDDSPDDTLLLERELRKGEWEIALERVDNRTKMLKRMEEESYGLIISDYIIPGFGGMEALELFKSYNLDIPFIMISGKITEEMAIEALQNGAQDFISKQNYSRMLPAIRRGIERMRIIKERKAANEALIESEMKFRLLAEYAVDCIFWRAEDGSYRYISPACESFTGYSPEEFLADANLMMQIVHPDDLENYLYHLHYEEMEEKTEFEYRIFHRDGSIHWISHNCKAIYDDEGNYLGRRGANRDITVKKEAEFDLIESENKLNKITESVQDAIILINNDGNIIFWNSAAVTIFGYTVQEVMYQNLHRLLAPERFLADHQKGFALFQHTGKGPDIGKNIELIAIRKGGDEFPIELSLSALELHGQWCAVGVVRDITERKESEGELKLFRSLLDHATDAIEVIDPESLRFLDVNTTGCKTLGYTREEFLTKSITDIDPAFTPEIAKEGREQLLQSGKFVFEGVHRRKDGSTFPVEVSTTLVTLDKAYILTMARDISDRRKAEEMLHRSLIGTVRAVSDIIEMRDPYTAGHQKRVASLACAIARELGMSEDKVEGLELAAQIHDVGKIQIPAEILSKPSQITAIEYLMIKTHPESGYQILKDIDFPWPIAEMVRQHHEKLDGSGYPHGLKGDDILMEARILTVADIVEAMASHRPYRAALGIEAALEYIFHQRGDKLDAEVVDVCVKLFREKRFNF